MSRSKFKRLIKEFTHYQALVLEKELFSDFLYFLSESRTILLVNKKCIRIEFDKKTPKWQITTHIKEPSSNYYSYDNEYKCLEDFKGLYDRDKYFQFDDESYGSPINFENIFLMTFLLEFVETRLNLNKDLLGIILDYIASSPNSVHLL